MSLSRPPDGLPIPTDAPAGETAPSRRPPAVAGNDHATTLLDLQAESARLMAELRYKVLGGQDWFEALLQAIGQWRLPAEEIDGRRFNYLIADEALDWLLLAERLMEPIADLVPEEEQIDLLFHGVPPRDLPEDTFKELIGATKYRAYLNFLYGVVLEEALIMSVQREIEKENRSRAYRDDRRTMETLHQRLYGRSFETLRAAFWEKQGQPERDVVTQADWKEFVYWLFKQRLRYWDKARIASDTRKAIRGLERFRQERRRHLNRPEAIDQDVIEAVVVEPGVFPDPYQTPADRPAGPAGTVAPIPPEAPDASIPPEAPPAAPAGPPEP